jgi:general secretion pathway protein G
MGSILDMYKLDVGSYPSSADGLAALVSKPSDADNWNGPYLKSSGTLLDPWNHAYIYRSPSNRSGLDYDLCSLGPKGQDASADSTDAICNH